MIEYIVKDIISVKTGIIAHGVNCQGAIGGGISGAIIKKWPAVYELFSKIGVNDDLLGSCHTICINHDPELYVANCYTQLNYGGNPLIKYADPESILHSLRYVYIQAHIYDLDVYMPKIGCGLGGLDYPTEVQPIMEFFNKRYPTINTYICDLE